MVLATVLNFFLGHALKTFHGQIADTLRKEFGELLVQGEVKINVRLGKIADQAEWRLNGLFILNSHRKNRKSSIETTEISKVLDTVEELAEL